MCYFPDKVSYTQCSVPIRSVTPDQGSEKELLNGIVLDHMTSKFSSGYNINMTGRKGTKILNRDYFYFSLISFHLFLILSDLL